MNRLEKFVAGWRIFSRKKVYQAKCVSLQLEFWEGAVSQWGPGTEFQANLKINVF